MTGKIVGCIELLAFLRYHQPLPSPRCFGNPGKRKILSVFYEFDCHPPSFLFPPVRGLSTPCQRLSRLRCRGWPTYRIDSRRTINKTFDGKGGKAQPVGVTVPRIVSTAPPISTVITPLQAERWRSLEIPEMRFIKSSGRFVWAPFTSTCNRFSSVAFRLQPTPPLCLPPPGFP